jgi:hypothetical protein
MKLHGKGPNIHETKEKIRKIKNTREGNHALN